MGTQLQPNCVSFGKIHNMAKQRVDPELKIARRIEYGKQYRAKNKEVIAQRKKDDVARHGERRRAKQKEWRENNAERHTEQKRRYFQENKETIYERRKGYAWTPEKQAAYIAEYRIKNKEQIRARIKAYIEGNESVKAKIRLLGRVRSIMKTAKCKMLARHIDRHIDFIGCKRLFFIAHIESLFKPGMTWENYGKGGWEIDHKKPCSSFDLTDPEQQKACFHYTNMQPLWKLENMKKGRKILTELTI